MSAVTVAAVDLGASSGRVLVGRGHGEHWELREVHRFPNVPVRTAGVLRWDVLGLFRGILDGLALATEAYGPLDSVGVDGWGVDYGLLDEQGQLLGNPAHYRDERTRTAVTEVLAEVGAAELYRATGTQLQPFNTLFQLRADRGSAHLAAATHAVLVPDLISYWLSGTIGTELTNASTTGLLDPHTRDWAAALATQLQVPIELFGPLRRPGVVLGQVLPAVLADAGLGGSPQVVAVPSHDTAAAVAGIPAGAEPFGYVCTGTWALVGLALTAPVVTEAARAANFTNEAGVDGSTRFLRNVTAFWLLQECLRHWRSEGLDTDAAELTASAALLPALHGVIDVQEPGFAAPGGMPGRIADACLRTSGVQLRTPAELTRCLLDSIALAVRHGLRDAVRLTGQEITVVHVVGGGAVNSLFCQLVADACQLPVLAGPIEAASWGNALSQARALGAVSGGLTRSIIGGAEPPTGYQPSEDDRGWQRADELVWAQRAELERR